MSTAEILNPVGPALGRRMMGKLTDTRALLAAVVLSVELLVTRRLLQRWRARSAKSFDLNLPSLSLAR